MEDEREKPSAALPRACEARYVKVAGAVGTGKTQAIVDRVATLAAAGVPAARIGVFAATSAAADALTDRLRAALGEGFGLEATTPDAYAVRLLSDERARAATGRTPRVLQDFEARILAEDLKVIGIKPHRMREMLKFFFKKWSDLGDERDDFLLSTEEHMLHDALLGHLKVREAMLAQEVTNIASKYLRRPGPGPDVWRYDYVLADDLQNMSRATQVMLDACARKQLFAAGNEAEQIASIEAYPYPEGFAQFETDHEGACAFSLDVDHRSARRILEAVNQLADKPGMQPVRTARPAEGAAEGTVKLVKWTLPNAEFLGVADYIERRTRKGEDPVHPRDIFVAVPNALWGRAVAKVLGDAGVPASLMVSYHALSGDPRSMEKSESLRAFTGLNLAASPRDATAWRSWCGFGDYLTHSNHWCRLEEYAARHGMGPVGALDCLSRSGGRPILAPDDAETEEDIALAEQEAKDAEKLNGLAFLGADVLVRRYREGQDLIARCEAKRGFGVINNLIDDPHAGMPAGFAELLEPVCGTEDARELYERACSRSLIQFADADAVRIGLPQMACGQEFDTVIVCGCVDGFMPPAGAFSDEFDDERKNQMKAAARRAFAATIGKARRTLVLSCFARDEANTAAALQMQIRRIRDVSGKRMAIIAPSMLLSELGQALPPEDAKL